jgi:superfamily II DNA or RNA helicase
MLNFNPIDGITGYYKSPLELILQGDTLALSEAKERLTLTNKSILKEIARLKQVTNPYHRPNALKKIKELEPDLITYCYAEVKEGLSVPPGYWYLAKHIETDGFDHRCNIKPVWVGFERYYQKEAITSLLSHKRASINLVTGSGKSLITRVLCRSFKAINKRVIVLVPSIELLKQTYASLKDDTYSVTMAGDGMTPKDGCDVLVTTAHSATQYADVYPVIVCDENMFLACSVWRQVCMAAINAEYFYSMSGSPQRSDGMTPLIWAWAGPLLYTYTAKQAITEGYLSKLIYKQINVDVPLYMNEKAPYVKEYIRFHKHPDFLAVVKAAIEKSLKSGRKTLVLFKSVACCKAMAEIMGCESADGKYRKPFYDFKAGKTDLLIANINLLGIGIDIPSIASLILCTQSSSEIAFIQAIGRALRVAEGKKNAWVFDMVINEDRWLSTAQLRANIARRYEV